MLYLRALMHFCTLSMSTMLAPCLVNFIMADMEPDGGGTKVH